MVKYKAHTSLTYMPYKNLGDDIVDLFMENDLDIVSSLETLSTALNAFILGISHRDTL
jgi:hypothetical protein